MADGSPDSLKMLLVFDKEGLEKVVVFKVYVVGEHVTCVKRKSLPDMSE